MTSWSWGSFFIGCGVGAVVGVRLFLAVVLALGRRAGSPL